MLDIQLQKAVKALLAGGLIAYPTEAVYGLGCIPSHRETVTRLLTIKKRSWRKGLTLIASNLEQLEPLIILPSGKLGEEILKSWPGPFTWIVDARHEALPWISGGRDTLAVRVTNHPIARTLCEQIGGPLGSTSANHSGQPPLRDVLQVQKKFGSELDYILGGEVGELKQPTVIKDGRSGELLREG